MANVIHSSLRTKRRLIIALLVVTILAALLMVAAAVILWNGGADDDVILKDNVVIYEEGESPFTILASDDSSVTVSSLDGIEGDSVLAAGVTEETPYGLLRKVVSYEPVDGGYRIATEQAALTEAIEQCDVSVSVAIVDDGSYTLAYQDEPTPAPFVDVAYADPNTVELFKKDLGSATITASLGMDIDLKCDVFEGIDFRFATWISANASIKDILSIDTTLFDKSFGPIEFFVGPLPVVIVPSLSVDATMEGSLSAPLATVGASPDKLGLQLDLELNREVGFEYSTKDGVRPICEDHSRCSDPAAVLGAEMEFGVSFSLTCLVYDVAGPELSAGIAANLSADLREVADAEASEKALRLFGTDRVYEGSYAFKVYLPITGKMVLEKPDNVFDLLSIERIEVDLFDTEDAITLLEIQEDSGASTESVEPGSQSVSFEDFPDPEVDESALTTLIEPIEGTVVSSDGMSTYTTPDLRVLPVFSFSFPDSWEVREETFDVKLDASHFVCEEVRIGNGDVEIVFCCRRQHPGSGNHQSYDTYTFEASSDFAPVPFGGVSYDDLGTFCVALASDTGWERIAGRPERHPEYAGEYTHYELVPRLWLDKDATDEPPDYPYYYQGYCQYGTKPAGGIGFYCPNDASALSDAQKAEVINILASLRVVL